MIARDPAAVALLRDGIIRQDALVAAFRTAASLAIFAGIRLFCFALVRSHEFPKSGGVVLFTGALLYGIHLSTPSAIASIFILSVGCLILGQRLMRPPAAGRQLTRIQLCGREAFDPAAVTLA